MRTLLASTLSSVLLLMSVTIAGTACGALPAEVDGQPLPTLAPMLERATPAVVNISTEGRVAVHGSSLFDDPFFRHFFDLPKQRRERKTHSLGSGVIVDAARGFVLTNHHVVEGAVQITVTLRDGRRLEADLVGADPESDVALIRIPSDALTAIPMADSDRLRVGDFVVAIGNPFGLGQTVTSGIVSALGRSGLGIEGYEDFIQTDASINPGNSGGALVNLRGELVGINTAILSRSGGNVGIGFAIPVNMAREIMRQVVEYGEVRRGLLGVTTQDLTPELANAFGLPPGGAVVIGVGPGSPAEQAGLTIGDVVQRANGSPVRDSADLRNMVGLQRPGSTVELVVWREGRTLALRATIAETTDHGQDGGGLHPRLAGARLSETGDPDNAHGYPGVDITAVEPGSPAARTGLREGDRIVAANNVPVGDLESLGHALERDARGLHLTLQRGSTLLSLRIR